MSRPAKIVGVTVALLLGVRACLPYAAERGIELAGNRLLDGRVTVENVDLGLLAGRFSLEGLRVDRRGQGEGAQAPPPIASLARLEVNAAPSALFRGALRVQEIDVDGVTVRLERAPNGDIVVPVTRDGVAAVRWVLGLLPLPLPVELDRVRVADMHALVFDPVDDVPSAKFDLASTELTNLRIENGQARLGRIAVGEPALLVDRGLVTGPRSLLRTWKTGTPAKPEVDVAAGPPSSAPSEPVAAPNPIAGLDAQLSEVAIEGAGFTWVDRTFQPVVQEQTKRISLVANDLVLRKQGFSNLVISGEALRGEPFEVSGGGATKDGFAIHLVAHEVDLTPFGRYAAELAGYDVKKGHVSIDTKLRADLPLIQTENEVVLRQLELEGKGFVEGSLGVAANLAIALMSGPDGAIHLKLPLDADLAKVLADPFAGARDAVEKTLARALQGVGGLGKGGSGLALHSLASTPGQTALAADQDKHLKSLVDLLRGKPSVAVILSGRTGDADAAPLAAQLGTTPQALSADQWQTLARRRAEAVGQVLAQRGVPASQVRIGKSSPPGPPGVLPQLALASD